MISRITDTAYDLFGFGVVVVLLLAFVALVAVWVRSELRSPSASRIALTAAVIASVAFFSYWAGWTGQRFFIRQYDWAIRESAVALGDGKADLVHDAFIEYMSVAGPEHHPHIIRQKLADPDGAQ